MRLFTRRSLRLVQGGFTLIELVVVLAVIGFASMLAVASLDRMATSSAERNWSDRTLHELRRMRLLAATRGDVVQAVLDSERLTLTWSDLTTHEGGQLVFPEAFSLSWASSGGQSSGGQAERVRVDESTLTLRFYPDGSAITREFRLHLPSGALHVFHVNGVSGRIWRGRDTDGAGA